MIWSNFFSGDCKYSRLSFPLGCPPPIFFLSVIGPNENDAGFCSLVGVKEEAAFSFAVARSGSSGMLDSLFFLFLVSAKFDLFFMMSHTMDMINPDVFVVVDSDLIFFNINMKNE